MAQSTDIVRRRILSLKVGSSNNSLRVVGKYFLDCVVQVRVTPRIFRGDACTENVDIAAKMFYKNGPYALFTSVGLRNTPYPSFSNRIPFLCLAYFLEIVAIYCMISTYRQHQVVYSISLLKQVRFITTEQDLSLVTSFMLSSLEPIKCMPFSRESVPKFGTPFRLIRLNYLNVRPFVKR